MWLLFGDIGGNWATLWSKHLVTLERMCLRRAKVNFGLGNLRSLLRCSRLPDSISTYLDEKDYFAQVRAGNCDVFKCNNNNNDDDDVNSSNNNVDVNN